VRIRHPPGRAGRPWLAHRLEVARRGAELLDDKHRALSSERRRLEPGLADARRAWERSAAEAERAFTRAAVLGGRRSLALARTDPAVVTVRWRTILGVTCPAEAELAGPGTPPPAELGGSAALLAAAEAHRRALEAALRLAVVASALGRIDVELRATALRRNAIQHRWIPAHEEAIAELGLALEELEREDGTRVRWVMDQARDAGIGPARQPP